MIDHRALPARTAYGSLRTVADLIEITSGLEDLRLDDLFDCGRNGISLVAEGESGSLVSIRDVATGLACRCKCPGCDRPMVAKNKGLRKAAHFAHHGTTGSTCTSAGETALHKFAKHLLNERLQIGLPGLSISEAGEEEIVVHPRPFSFDKATLEKRTGKIVPDVVLVRDDRKLMVEFMVTHACGPEKIDLIRELDIGAIEIDLSSYRSMKLRDVGDKILFEAARSWLHNPKTPAARKRARKRAEDKAAEIATEVQALSKVYRHRAPSYADGTGKAETAIRQDGLGCFIDLDTRGSGCFTVSLAEWQATVLMALVNAKPQGLGEESIYCDLEERGWLEPRFRDLAKGIAAGLRIVVPNFEIPSRSVRSYLKLLAERGLLVSGNSGLWRATDRLKLIVAEAREVRRRPAKHFDEAKTLVLDLLKGLPTEETADFVFEHWAKAPLGRRNDTLMEALHSDEPLWQRLVSDLRGLPRDIRFQPRADLDLMGLPLAGALARSLESKEQERAAREETQRRRAEAAANARVGNLKSWAWQGIGALADDWLTSPNDLLEGRRPIEVAVLSDDEYVRAGRVLEKRIGEFRRAEAARRAKEKALSALRAKLCALFDEQRVELWMRGTRHELGSKSPESFVIDDQTLAECMKLLPDKKRMRR